jgi:hypothetical protein
MDVEDLGPLAEPADHLEDLAGRTTNRPPAPDPDPGIAGGNTARVYNFDAARLTLPA